MATLKDLQAEAQRRGLCCFWKLKKAELAELLASSSIPKKYKKEQGKKTVKFRDNVSEYTAKKRVQSPPPKTKATHYTCASKLCGKL